MALCSFCRPCSLDKASCFFFTEQIAGLCRQRRPLVTNVCGSSYNKTVCKLILFYHFYRLFQMVHYRNNSQSQAFLLNLVWAGWSVVRFRASDLRLGETRHQKRSPLDTVLWMESGPSTHRETLHVSEFPIHSYSFKSIKTPAMSLLRRHETIDYQNK